MSRIAVGVSYSSDVELWLRIAGGATHRLSKAGPNRVTPVTGIDAPPGPASVVVIVDGNEFIRDVTLPHGAVPFDDSITIECANA